MLAATITVALVEDDDGARQRFERVISASPRLRFLHGAGTAAEILMWLVDNPVDVLLVDLGLPDQSGLEVIRRCRVLQPACEVMVVTIFGDEVNMLSAFRHGARGYLLKDGTEEDLARHVLQLQAGGSPMSPMIARQLLGLWQSGRPSHPTPALPPLDAPHLTAKERQVLDLVARGFTYQETAHHCTVSLNTVQSHVRNIYAKLDVHNKAEALHEARLLGLLDGS